MDMKPHLPLPIPPAIDFGMRSRLEQVTTALLDLVARLEARIVELEARVNDLEAQVREDNTDG